MAEAITPVTVLFGGKPKSTKPNPTKAKPVMYPTATEHVYKEPTHDERLHRAAADEHVHATREYVGGRISKAEFEKRKSRAATVMSRTPKAKK